MGYFTEIAALQYRQRPPRKIQPTTGTLSYQASRCLHLGHWEGGQRSDFQPPVGYAPDEDIEKTAHASTSRNRKMMKVGCMI